MTHTPPIMKLSTLLLTLPPPISTTLSILIRVLWQMGGTSGPECYAAGHLTTFNVLKNRLRKNCDSGFYIALEGFGLNHLDIVNEPCMSGFALCKFAGRRHQTWLQAEFRTRTKEWVQLSFSISYKYLVCLKFRQLVICINSAALTLQHLHSVLKIMEVTSGQSMTKQKLPGSGSRVAPAESV